MTDLTPGWAAPGGDRPRAPAAEVPPAVSVQPGWQQDGWGAPKAPEVRPGVIPLRPLALGEILDGAIAVIRRYPRPVLGLSAAVAVVSLLANLVLLLTSARPDAGQLTALRRGDASQLDPVLGRFAAGSGFGAVVSSLAGVLLTGVITAVVGQAVLGRPATLAEAWRQVRPLLPRLLGLSLLLPVLVFGPLVLAAVLSVGLGVAGGGFVPAIVLVPLSLATGVYLYVRYALAPAVLVLERQGVRASLRRSGRLVNRSWWRVLGILVLAVVITGFLTSVLEVPISLLTGVSAGGLFSGHPSTGALVASQVGAALAGTVVAPFNAGIRALVYIDRRMRAEGLDVTLAATAGTVPPAA